ncbi:hypothetical protein KDA00_02260 [Candidatus Saccharibacteria bacterium]|nr:hypothetical protein [Candidatus Saccharibacteria bacterium]
MLTSCFISFNFIHPIIVNAQQNKVEIGVSPAIIETAGSPGEKVEKNIAIINGSSNPLPIHIETRSLLTLEEIINAQKASEFDASQWLELKQGDLILGPNATKEIQINIQIPSDATPGGHYTQLNIQGIGVDQVLGQQSGGIIIPEVASSVFITVSGDIDENIYHTKRNQFPIYSQPSRDQIASMNIENNGNVHNLIVPEVNLRTIGYNFTAKLQPHIILPNSKKEIKDRWQTPSRPGIYLASIKYRYGNQGNEQKTKTEIMIIMPHAGLLTSMIIIVLIFCFLYIKRNNIKPAIRALANK